MHKLQYNYNIIFFNVGQGDATLIQSVSTKSSVLIDAKNGKPICNFLCNAAKLEAIFITHWDQDHIYGIPEILNWLSENRQNQIDVFVSPKNSCSKIAKRLARRLNEADEDKIISIKSPFNENIKKIGGDFYVLWPQYKQCVINPDERNNSSLVLRFEAKLFTLLLGGDADGSVWPQIDAKWLKADILKYPHHGAKLKKSENDWSGTELISAVKPRRVVVSVGKNNSYCHPSSEFKKANSNFSEIEFFSTENGNINIQVETTTGKMAQTIYFG